MLKHLKGYFGKIIWLILIIAPGNVILGYKILEVREVREKYIHCILILKNNYVIQSLP